MSAIAVEQKITQHYDEDKNLTWVEVVDEGYHAGFDLDPNDETLGSTLIETVDFSHGLPNWNEAGEVDVKLASNPELVRKLEVMFGLKESRMDSGFAVFNGHVNNAAERANAEFIAQFGQEKYDKEIAPLHENGIMSIFEGEPTLGTLAWVTLVTAFVNEDRA